MVRVTHSDKDKPATKKKQVSPARNRYVSAVYAGSFATENVLTINMNLVVTDVSAFSAKRISVKILRGEISTGFGSRTMANITTTKKHNQLLLFLR